MFVSRAIDCADGGNADMYGLGIRLGFYLQWYGVSLAAWMAPEEVPSMRVTTMFFTAATFLATVIGTARDTLDPIEVYIILLLNFGTAFFLIPLFTWRFSTGFNPRWDPTRLPRAKPPSRTFNFLHLLLLLAVACFQVWYWSAMRGFHLQGCGRRGFFFGRETFIYDNWFRILNVVLAVLLLVILAIVLCMVCVDGKKEEKYDEDWGDSEHRIRLRWFQIADTFICLGVSCIVVAAAEYTIAKNHIQNVNMLDTAGQLIPFVLGIAGVIRIVYKAVYDVHDDKTSTSQTDEGATADHTGAAFHSTADDRTETQPRHSKNVTIYPAYRLNITPGAAARRSVRRVPDIGAARSRTRKLSRAN